MSGESPIAVRGDGYVAGVEAAISDISELPEIDLSEVEAVVGSGAFKRGRAYARSDRVLTLAWQLGTGALTGSVVGNGAVYRTTAYLAEASGSREMFDGGECTCPVGTDCKHVAAVMVAAADRHGGGPPLRLVRPPGEGAEEGAVRPWEEPLRALIDTPVAQATGKPLAIELQLQVSRGRDFTAPPRLMARLMRPGARGGWVNGQLEWGGLDSWQVHSGDYRADHVALARELCAVQRARQRHSYYYSGYGPEKTLDLGDCGAQLWPLLDEAARLGLPLIHGGQGLGELAPYAEGEIVIDVTQEGDGDSLVRALPCIDGDRAEDPEPILFLGEAGHGMVCAGPLEHGQSAGQRLHLVRLGRSAPPELQRMVLSGRRVTVPQGERERFAADIFPALRNFASVVSSDGSFTPPEVSGPTLALRASYGGGHAVEVAWEWTYQVGSASRRAPIGLNGKGPGFRDLGAEREVLRSLDLSGSGLERHGLLDAAGRPAALGPVSLDGVASMQLTTEELPQLSGRDGIAVEIEGEPADYRDVSDSLEIGVATAEIAGERDWFDLGVTISVEGRELPFAEVFAALARGASDMLLEDGAYFSLSGDRLQSLRSLIDEARSLADSPPDELRISRYQAGLWSELTALGIVTEQAEAWQRRVGPLLELGDLSTYEPPAAVTAKLRPYQRDGFGWLASISELGLGGILADDMGLGKTLQALALICHARERDTGTGPFLVVAPTSVVSGWAGEAARFAPGLSVEPVMETLRKSGRAIEGVVADADVVVTSYTLLRLDADAYREVSWAGVILDEAQYVKNHQAKTYRAVRELEAPFKLALTGTPMENNLMELWSLLSITAPGLFPDPKRFAERYARPIERAGDGEQLARLRQRIKPLVKRRTKELVTAELPAKQEQTLEVDLHARHRKLYDTYLQRERQRVLGLLDDFDRNRITILRSITLLRQLSLHPGLVDSDHDAIPCAKLGALAEQLAEVTAGGHRALVFSQFTGFLTKVRDRLDQEGIGYCYLDGRTRKRERVIERFKVGDDPVFLISLKAGGFGLNLTEADYCFLLDPWWNPATENQAIDRTHRIGQTRPVMAYRLIARETIEEKVVALARRKAKLFRGVMDEGELFSSRITAEDIRGLLG